jgi:sulfofructose kinase
MPVDVIGMGNSCVDVLLAVERFAERGESVPVSAAETQTGGQVASAMVGVARLGHSVEFALRTGRDALGEQQWQALAAAGVDLSLGRRIANVPSAVACILVNARTGERIVVWKTDPRLAVHPGDIPEDCVRNARVLYLDGKDEEACVHYARLARREGVTVVCDIDAERPRTRELIGFVDHFIANEEFTATLTGLTDVREALRAIAAMGPSVACITLAEMGAVAFDHALFLFSPAFEIAAVDTTGGGDAFRAGYVHALLRGLHVADRLRYGNAAAALCCLRRGAQNGMPRLDELERFLSSVRTQRRESPPNLRSGVS